VFFCERMCRLTKTLYPAPLRRIVSGAVVFGFLTTLIGSGVFKISHHQGGGVPYIVTGAVGLAVLVRQMCERVVLRDSTVDFCGFFRRRTVDRSNIVLIAPVTRCLSLAIWVSLKDGSSFWVLCGLMRSEKEVARLMFDLNIGVGLGTE
jgi:hypothetical protein